MATHANQELLTDADLLTAEGKQAKPEDLLIVVRGQDEKAVASALAQVDELLKRRRSKVAQEFRPHSLKAATEQLPTAHWVLISVPGRYAAGVARESLELDKHVFLYSDNVSVEDEVALKKYAQEKGLLVMGPDCGTAIINGIGLGFANRVQRGNIGLVGASGTGLQAITAEIHNLGGGVSHAIGTGGRDLKFDVGAITAMQGIELLASDPETNVIVIVSKPPAPDVATKLLNVAQSSGKPVVVDFIGYPPPGRELGNLNFVTGLTEAAEIAVRLSKSKNSKTQSTDRKTKGYLRGLFSGGTLAYEALLNLQAVLSPIYSNVPFTESQKLADPLTSQAHSIIDLGEDIFTVGRLHPMLDNDLRIRRLRQEAEDEQTAVLLLDIVLGEGSHPDPASELAPVLAEIKKQRKDLEIVAIIVGTEEDPQDVNAQIKAFTKAGASVYRNTNQAAAYIAAHFAAPLKSSGSPVNLKTLQAPFAAINVGLESFYESLKGQGAEVVHVDWRPPAGGNEDLMAILAKMKSS
jgi:FdrA protein